MSLNTAPVTSKRNEPKDKKFSKIYICLITFHMAKFSRVLFKWSRGEYFELLWCSDTSWDGLWISECHFAIFFENVKLQPAYKYSPCSSRIRRRERLRSVAEHLSFMGSASSLVGGAVQWCHGRWNSCHTAQWGQQFHLVRGGRHDLRDLLQYELHWRPLGGTQLPPTTD